MKIYKRDTEYPFDHGKVINYTLDDVSIPPSHYKDTGVLPNSVAGEEGPAQECHNEPNGDFQSVTDINTCNRRKLRMDQQHCGYPTILT